MEKQKSNLEPVEFKQGEVLFKENETSFHFFIIQEGQVEVYKTNSDGKQVVLATVGEGLPIGEFAMIDRRPRSATARAATPVKAMKISEAAYKQLLEDLPDWAVSVMTGLVDRLRSTNEIVRKLSMDQKAKQAIEKVEFDDSSIRRNPLFSDDDDDENPDLV